MATQSLNTELDRVRATGPAQHIVIPPCPDLLVRLQATMNQPDPDWHEVVDIACEDVAMSVTLIRRANSPLYKRRDPVESLEQAVQVLGLQRSSLILSEFLVTKALPATTPIMEYFWDRSAQRALAMEYIAKQLYELPSDLAYTFGLFCDVGMPVMMQSIPGYAGTLAEAFARTDQTIIETENKSHQTDHAVIGALVSRTWHLSTVITQGIRLHHDFNVFDDAKVSNVVKHLIASALVAEHLVHQCLNLPDTQDWNRHHRQALEVLHVGIDELEPWVEHLSVPITTLQL